MSDPYLYPNENVLRNLLEIHDEKALDLAEAELSRASMMLLYEQGFSDFSSSGLQTIHNVLFGDVYEWAGQFRLINIKKREHLLAGKSIWYSNTNDIEDDLEKAWAEINAIPWADLEREEFALNLANHFPPLWRVHPFS